jgi:hypothetical protein
MEDYRIITTPRLEINTTDSDIIAGNFKFKLQNLSYIDTVKHVSTDWILVDGNDKVVFASKNDTNNLTKIQVSKSLLKIGAEYTLLIGLHFHDNIINEDFVYEALEFPFIATKDIAVQQPDLPSDNYVVELNKELGSALTANNMILTDLVKAVIYGTLD